MTQLGVRLTRVSQPACGAYVASLAVMVSAAATLESRGELQEVAYIAPSPHATPMQQRATLPLYVPLSNERHCRGTWICSGWSRHGSTVPERHVYGMFLPVRIPQRKKHTSGIQTCNDECVWRATTVLQGSKSPSKSFCQDLSGVLRMTD